MCNLYSHTKGPKAIRDLANANRLFNDGALSFEERGNKERAADRYVTSGSLSLFAIAPFSLDVRPLWHFRVRHQSEHRHQLHK